MWRTSRYDFPPAVAEQPIAGTAPAARPRTDRKALTLLEMVLVLGLLVIVLALTIPSVDRMYDRHRLRQAAAELRARLASARLRAIDEGLPVEFRYEPGGREMLVGPHGDDVVGLEDAVNNSRSRLDRSEWTRRTRLPETLRFAATDAAGEPVPSASTRLAWSHPVIFRPDGSATHAEFHVVDAEGRFVTLQVRALTGIATSTGPIALWKAPSASRVAGQPQGNR